MLLDHGHPHAYRYPLGMLKDEAALVTARINGVEATRAILLQMAISTMFSPEAGKAFTELTTRLSKG